MPPWDQLAERCGLTLTAPPRPLSGGFLHRMFALETRQGRFAVKLLSPAIMRRPDALDRYRRAEALEARLEEAGLPILPALRVKDSKLQEVDGQYFYLFDYFDGHSLQPGELIPARTEAIGRTLATLHTVHRRPDSTPLPKPENDWPRYAALLSSREPSLHAQLTGALPLLTALEQRARGRLTGCRPCGPSATATWTARTCSGRATPSASSTWSVWTTEARRWR